MGQPELGTDPRFADQNSRNRNEDLTDELVAKWTLSRDLADLERALEAGNVPASRIFTMADIFKDPHYRARDMLVKTSDDDLGSVTLAGIVPRLSGTPGQVRWSGRRTGQDTRAVLRKYADLSDARIDELDRTGVVFCDLKSDSTAAPTGAGG